MSQNFALGNIKRVVPVDLSGGDFTDENGFFLRAGTSGLIKYCPMGNSDSEYIIKQFDASSIFIDPELCRKVFAFVTSPGTTAADIYAGYGV